MRLYAFFQADTDGYSGFYTGAKDDRLCPHPPPINTQPLAAFRATTIWNMAKTTAAPPIPHAIFVIKYILPK